MLDIIKYCEEQEQDNIVLSHRGALDSETIDILLKLAEKNLIFLKTKKKARKKIFNILVECLQNCFHYSTSNKEVVELFNSNFLVIVKESDKFVIFVGNNITRQRAEVLKVRIEKIQAMSNEDLRSTYIQKLDKDSLPIEGGAGLGLMDIARRSNKHMSFMIHELDNGYWFYALQIEVQS